MSRAAPGRQVQFYHEWRQNLPVGLSRRFRLFVALFILLVSTGMVWAITAPIQGAFLSQGRLVAEGQNRVVDHLEGGIVEKVFVHEGDRVEAGELLALVDVTNALANLTSARHERAVQQIKLARYLAEQAGAEKLEWPADVAELINSDKKVAEAAATQLEEFESSRQENVATQRILKERIANARDLVTNLEDLSRERSRRVKEAEAEVELSTDLLKRGLTTRDRNFNLRRQLSSDQDQLQQTLLDIADKKSTINQTQEQLEGFLSQRAADVNQQILDLQAEIFKLGEKIRAYSAVVDRAEVRAPVSGVIVDIAVNTQNQVMAAGTPLFEIFPSDLRMTIEARVAPHYIDSVAMGQHVTVQFEARERTKSRKMVEGRVEFIAGDSQLDEKTGEYYYLVRAKLDRASVEDYGVLVPGATSTVYFQLTRQTFLQYLIDPYWDLQQKAFVG